MFKMSFSMLRTKRNWNNKSLSPKRLITKLFTVPFDASEAKQMAGNNDPDQCNKTSIICYIYL